MEDIRLIIKYKNKFFCECDRNKITFICVPKYYLDIPDINNVEIFMEMFLHNLLNESYGSKKTMTIDEWEVMGMEDGYMFPSEYGILYECYPNTFLCDIDKLLLDYIDPSKVENDLIHIQESLPKSIVYLSLEELKDLTVEIEKEKDWNELESYNGRSVQVSKLLIKIIESILRPVNEKDVLLMYSGGKDSTLSAIRLRKLGYNVHFIHFDNGYERDSDKPFLTFTKIFSNTEGYYFNYADANVDISDLFSHYKEILEEQVEINAVDTSLISELCCLSCRSAMYMAAINKAIEMGYKFIADGARIHQKFMLEQVPMIKKYQELCKRAGITLLCPVLTLEDDQALIEELLENGYSAKTWESKCLIGKPAKDKTEADEQIIMQYFDENIKDFPRLSKK